MKRLVRRDGVIALALVLGLSTAATGCSGLRNQCTDGLDNDRDGLVDGQDPACIFNAARNTAAGNLCNTRGSGLGTGNPGCSVSATGFAESDDPQCFDGKDNDDDGLYDQDDPGCTSLTDADETNNECADGEDNDGDGLVDAGEDPDCAGDPKRATERPVRAGCSDGIDNDNDGKTDFPADKGCTDRTDQTEREAACIDGEDNDRDGLIDALDPGCAGTADDSEINPGCSDGIDNDFDGLVDALDPGCTSPLDTSEENATCSDGLDNDGDGLIDYPEDLGCTRPGDANEANPACSDGVDNDGDGRNDFATDGTGDPGCASPRDSSESKPSCANGIDDDGDGFADFSGVDRDGDGVLDLQPDRTCASSDQTYEDSDCSNGEDDDGDGLVDLGDPDCTSYINFTENTASACADGLDNDGDGFTDYPQDTGCTAATDAAEGDETDGDCTDGIDNDGDGGIDSGLNNRSAPDAACVAGYAFEELDPVCDDNQDNDGDGRADFAGVDLNFDGLFDGPGEFSPDPGCLAATGFSEARKPQCSDGLDNDGDLTADWAGVDVNGDGVINPAEGDLQPDVNCRNADPVAAQRLTDEGVVPQCADGIDNDGDGRIDFETEFLVDGSSNGNFANRDLECTSAFDNLEAQQ